MIEILVHQGTVQCVCAPRGRQSASARLTTPPGRHTIDVDHHHLSGSFGDRPHPARVDWRGPFFRRRLRTPDPLGLKNPVASEKQSFSTQTGAAPGTERRAGPLGDSIRRRKIKERWAWPTFPSCFSRQRPPLHCGNVTCTQSLVRFWSSGADRGVRVWVADPCAFETLAAGAACACDSGCARTGDATAAMAVAARITFRFVLMIDLAISFCCPRRRYVARISRGTRHLRVTKLCLKI